MKKPQDLPIKIKARKMLNFWLSKAAKNAASY